MRELAPDGMLVGDHALPAGVSALSGIAFDDARGEAFLTGTSGKVWRVGGFPDAVAPPLLSIAPGTNQITWTSLPEAAYRVEYRDALSAGAWSALEAGIVATGSLTTWTDNAATEVPTRFYRVVVTAPPQ